MEGEAVSNESDHEEMSDTSSSFGEGSVGPSQRKLLASKLIMSMSSSLLVRLVQKYVRKV